MKHSKHGGIPKAVKRHLSIMIVKNTLCVCVRLRGQMVLLKSVKKLLKSVIECANSANGEIMKTQRSMKPISQRFWEKVDKNAPNNCWEWTSSIRGNGYGAFFTHLIEEGRKCHGAHRYSWELTNGQIPNGLWVLHKCDNRICVNPDHLFLGNRTDNMKDCAIKRRVCTIGKSNLTHCKRGHEFTEENTWKTKQGWRLCKSCASLRKAREQA